MNEIEKIVRDWIREIGRVKTREVCIKSDEICKNLKREPFDEHGNTWMKAFNKVARSVYYYDGLGEAISFAESLGWADRFGDSQDGEWSPAIADSCEAEVLEYIESKGYRVINYTEEV